MIIIHHFMDKIGYGFVYGLGVNASYAVFDAVFDF
jgi:hypothetical protein